MAMVEVMVSGREERVTFPPNRVAVHVNASVTADSLSLQQTVAD